MHAAFSRRLKRRTRRTNLNDLFRRHEFWTKTAEATCLASSFSYAKRLLPNKPRAKAWIIVAAT